MSVNAVPRMSEANTFTLLGIQTQWDDDHIVITELGFDRTALLANDGTILSSTFGKEGESFLQSWFRKVKPMIDSIRAFDREHAHA